MGIAIMVCIILLFIGISTAVKQGKEQNERLKGCSLICLCKYYGGYEDKMDSTTVSLFHDSNKGQIAIAFGDGDRRILIKDIKDLTTKKEEELRQEVTLGRFLLVGALAILWKKNKIENRKFVIINYYDQEENKDRKILFESPVAEIIYTKLKEVIKNAKEYNVN